MSIYINERKGKRVRNDVLKYFLNKFRHTFHVMENERRASLQKLYNK